LDATKNISQNQKLPPEVTTALKQMEEQRE
jgi:hypothetical protein